MISVAAIRMQQFGVHFYQASLTASDIDKLVRFEVLSYGEQTQPPVRGSRRRRAVSRVNWDLPRAAPRVQRAGLSTAHHSS